MKDSNELFELCRRVYEATGWDGTDRCRAYLKNPYVDVWDWETIPCHEDNVADVDEWYPLYTSDYLLERLPPALWVGVSGGGQQVALLALNMQGNSEATAVYELPYDKEFRGSYSNRADTPLKALLKLTLKLHEEGLL